MESSEEDAIHLKNATTIQSKQAPARLHRLQSLESSEQSSSDSNSGEKKNSINKNNSNLLGKSSKQLKAALPSLTFGKNNIITPQTNTTMTSNNSDTSINFEVAQESESDVSLDLTEPDKINSVKVKNDQENLSVSNKRNASTNGNKLKEFKLEKDSIKEESILNISQSFQLHKTQSPLDRNSSNEKEKNLSKTRVNGEESLLIKKNKKNNLKRKENVSLTKTKNETLKMENIKKKETDKLKQYEDEEFDKRSDSLVQEILPFSSKVPSHSSTTTAAAAAATTTTTTVAPISHEKWNSFNSPYNNLNQNDPVEKMLLRARQRLQEKDALELRTSKVTPKASFESPHSFSRFATPDRVSTYHESPSILPLTISNNVSQFSEERNRRLQQEINRLQDEVLFLSKENQKLKDANKEYNISQNSQLQMTCEILRGQLQEEELQRQISEQNIIKIESEAKRIVSESEEQLQSYISTASQYKKLYNEKIHETEELKAQIQFFQNQIQEIEEKKRQQKLIFEQEKVHERENSERTLALLEEAKKQRSHLLELNEKLQHEKESVIMDRRRIKEELYQQQEGLRRLEERYNKERSILEEDCIRLKDILAEKDRTLHAQLKNAQQANEILKQRLIDVTEQARDDLERNRRSYETSKQEFQKNLSEERDQRIELERKFNFMQEEISREKRVISERISHEFEEKVTLLNKDLLKVCSERDDLHERFENAKKKIEKLEEICSNYQNKWESLTSQRRESQEVLSQLDTQRVRLTETMQQLLERNDQLREENSFLRSQLENHEKELHEAHLQMESFTTLQEEVHNLSRENERLSEECNRLSSERSALIEENGKIAEEVLKWRNEIRFHLLIPHTSSPKNNLSRKMSSSGD